MIDRKQIGDPVHYKEHLITVTHMGPDLLAYVDGSEISNFYMNREAALKAAREYIDQIEKQKGAKK